MHFSHPLGANSIFVAKAAYRIASNRLCSATITILLLFCWSSAALASESQLALVLGGGGARGGAHIGILKELDKQGIVPDIIVGTSIGALIGGLYAAGNSGAEIESLLKQAQLETLFQQVFPRASRSYHRKEDDKDLLIKLQLRLEDKKWLVPSSLVSSHKFRLWLAEQFAINRNKGQFFGLDVKFATVGTDLVSGSELVLDKGSIEESIYTSMAVPGLMEPLDRNNLLIVDGGLVNNLPIDVAQKYGATHIIAVDVGTPFYKKDQINSSIKALDQMTRLLVRGNTQMSIANANEHSNTLLFHPELDGIKTGSFVDLDKAITEGERVAALFAKELREYKGISKRDDRQIVKVQGNQHDGLKIRSLEFSTDSALSDLFFRSYFDSHVGGEFNYQVFEKDLQRLYGTELFNRINYSTKSQSAQNVDLQVLALEKRGRDFLQFGLTLDEDFKSVSEYGLNFSFSRTQFNSRGAELKTQLKISNSPSISTELYQPFGPRSQYFAAIGGTFEHSNEDARQDPEASSIDIYYLEAKLGRYFSTWGRASLERIEGRAQIESISDIKYHASSLSFGTDTLDDPAFPTQGTRFTLVDRWVTIDFPQLSLKANELSMDVAKFISKGRNTLGLWGTLALNTDDKWTDNTIYSGGLFNLSGYARNELELNNLLLARALYYRRLGNTTLTSVFSFPLYVGASLEYAKTTEIIGDNAEENGVFAGSGFIGFNSVFGPLFIGVGLADTGKKRIYLSLGRPFVYDLTSATLQL